MKKSGLLLFAIFYLLTSYVQAQVKPALPEGRFTISGYVKDTNTGEELIGATVAVKELSNTGAITNAYGFYSITIPIGSYTLTAQFI